MMWRPAVLFLLLTGCVSPAIEQEWRAGAIDAFGEPVELVRVGSAEPGSAVAPDGTAYVYVWDRVFREGPDGWSEVTSPFPVGGDTSLAIDAQGVLHFVGMALPSERGPRLPYAWSSDRGS